MNKSEAPARLLGGTSTETQNPEKNKLASLCELALLSTKLLLKFHACLGDVFLWEAVKMSPWDGNLPESLYIYIYVYMYVFLYIYIYKIPAILKNPLWLLN